eukprot:4792215-Prymnesium_polylepis.2
MRMTARSSSWVGGDPGGLCGLSRSSLSMLSGVMISAQYIHLEGFLSSSNIPTAMITGATSVNRLMSTGTLGPIFVHTGRRYQGFGEAFAVFELGSTNTCAAVNTWFVGAPAPMLTMAPEPRLIIFLFTLSSTPMRTVARFTLSINLGARPCLAATSAAAAFAPAAALAAF